MPAVARLGDICTGHGWWPSRPSVEGCNSVFVNNIPVHCEGHAWAAHTCPSLPETHGGVLVSGWNNVYCENKKIGYVGASISCGSSVASGSSNVFVGEWLIC